MVRAEQDEAQGQDDCRARVPHRRRCGPPPPGEVQCFCDGGDFLCGHPRAGRRGAGRGEWPARGPPRGAPVDVASPWVLIAQGAMSSCFPSPGSATYPPHTHEARG